MSPLETALSNGRTSDSDWTEIIARIIYRERCGAWPPDRLPSDRSEGARWEKWREIAVTQIEKAKASMERTR